MGKEGKRDRSNCGTAACLDIVGDRWTLLIVRAYIFIGCREYSHFLNIPEGISTNVLADRLSWMVKNDILTKHRHPTNRTKYFYDMTEKGFDLIFVVMEMARWSKKHIPDSFAPPHLYNAFLEDAEAFRLDWIRRAKELSATYTEGQPA